MATPLTPPEHEYSAAIDEAAAWLAARPPHHHPRPIVPELRKLFGLTAVEACEAIRQANEIRRAAH